MKKRMIAMALLIVMLFALSACSSGQQAAAPAAQPAASSDAAQASDAPASDAQPADAQGDAQSADAQGDAQEGNAVATENAIPEGSGVVSMYSEQQGFSVDFDSDKYTAFPNLVGNIDILAGQDEGIPKVTVALHLQENSDDAATYLKTLAEGIEAEKGKNMVSKASEPKKVDYGDRDLYYIVFSYKDKEAGGNVRCVYYAENLKGGDMAVYSSSALEGQTEDVDAIIALAIKSFKFGK